MTRRPRGPDPSPAARAHLRLSLARGVGARTVRQLVLACGSAETALRLRREELTRIEGVGPSLAEAIATAPDARPLLDDCSRLGIALLCPEDSVYPEPLATLDDAPPILFARGDPAALGLDRLLAVVGARRASREGRLVARRWSRHLAGGGIGIVSGMAYGVDAAAHGGCLEAGGITVAVLGCGLAAVHDEQRRQIDAIAAADGCVVSEYPPRTGARPEHFPRRNRIIAGLAHATLVVEAEPDSGSLITARCAADYGREVLAVPGSVLSGRHGGCHALIRDGAALAESTDDVARTLGWTLAGRSGATIPEYVPANESEAKVIEALGRDILHIDALAERCGLTVPDLSTILLALELLGVVERLPGSRYTRNTR